MNKVVAEFSGSVGTVALTDFQKRLAQNYFISLDATLKAAEEKRQGKLEKYRDPLPLTWQNVNMEKLARDVVAYARVGFDPAQRNHINMVPFKNSKTNKYDIGFIEGYRGMELKAVKYGLEVPDSVVVDLVYSTDRFKPIKRDRNNPHDDYDFEVLNAFDRGDIVGGFYYHSYSQAPQKNKLVTMSLKDILKRRPDHASPEFWGGEKDVWEKDQQTGKSKKVGTEQVEGWYDKMCWKTIYRAAYGDLTIDSQKIDDDYLRLKQAESEFEAASVQQEISENANRGEVIDIEHSSAQCDAGPVTGSPQSESKQPDPAAATSKSKAAEASPKSGSQSVEAASPPPPPTSQSEMSFDEQMADPGF
ncbi:MAG: recombinase RecT [Paenibacillaceae bacterium]|nr:recombinase RecT [Paenibacillaceae bacterium]